MREDVTAFINYRFEKIRRLNGENKKNAVYLVTDRQTKQLAVMRFIKSGKIPCAELRDMTNPLLAKIIYCAQDESETVIVEEYLTGETLSQILDGGKFFDESTAQDFLLQMCDGLKILHAAGIIHRDIKPSNLIRQSDGRIKLIDFDAARIFKADNSRDTKHLGTEGYAPPEQYGFSQTDSRSDIYALGVTAKEMLGKNYRGRLEKILAKCTAYDPQFRYQSADELKIALTHREADKKSYGGKIFVICAAIIFSAGIFYFNSTDEKNIPAEIPTLEEKISVPEKPVEIVEEVKPKPKEKFTFAEIVLPQEITTSTLIATPPPSPINLPPMTSETPQIEIEDVKPAENFVRAKYFLNGKFINDWMNELTEDVEVTHMVHIPAEVWQNNSTPISGTLEIVIENFSAKSFTPQLEINFDDDGNVKTKTLNGQILNSGQNLTFRIPLNEFRVESLKNAFMCSAELGVKILGGNVIGSTATINFMFVQKGFPIIEN